MLGELWCFPVWRWKQASLPALCERKELPPEPFGKVFPQTQAAFTFMHVHYSNTGREASTALWCSLPRPSAPGQSVLSAAAVPGGRNSGALAGARHKQALPRPEGMSCGAVKYSIVQIEQYHSHRSQETWKRHPCFQPYYLKAKPITLVVVLLKEKKEVNRNLTVSLIAYSHRHWNIMCILSIKIYTPNQ